MKKFFLAIISILVIFFVIYRISREDNNVYIEVCASPETRLFMTEVVKKYEKINKDKNIKIRLYFDDSIKSSDNSMFSYITKDDAGYEEWKSLQENKNQNKKIDDFYYYLSSQKYKFDDKYGKFDIIIYTDDYLDKYFEESKYTIKNFLRDRLVIIGRRELEEIKEIEDYKISVPNPKTKIGDTVYTFLLNNIDYDKLISNMEYQDDSLLALQSTDLYESDYAIVGKISSKIAKNSFECYEVPLYLSKAIDYKIAVKDLENENAILLYNFLTSEETKKIYNEYIK